MAKLIIKAPGAPAFAYQIKPGVNRFGRSGNTDFQILHPSVSSVHCEVVSSDGTFVVRDLGSTNGTQLDGRPIQESFLVPGQTLRLGDVEITFEPPPETPASVPVAPPRMRLAPVRAVQRPKNFYKSIPGAFVFPLRRNGLILLLSGAVFFVVMNFLRGYAGIVGLGLAVFTCGYLFSFMQAIITTTALGEGEMPAWPDFDGWTDSALAPFLQLLGIFALCLGPAFFYSRFAEDPEAWLTATLLIAGLLYLPMALLAVAMYDSLAAVNPMLVLLSIMRVPVEYAATCLVLGLLVLAQREASHSLHEAVQQVPLLPTVVEEFLSLYTLTVVMRVAGLLFYTKQDRLGWEMGGK